MGGHQSRQTLSATGRVVTTATLAQMQNCQAHLEGQNVVTVDGEDNTVEGVHQDLALNYNKGCVQHQTSRQGFEESLSNTIAQSLKSQEVALTSWLSAGSSDQADVIKNLIRNDVTTNVVQDCMGELSGRNIVRVRGRGNVEKDVTQALEVSVVQKCMQGTANSMKAIAGVTNLANQHLSHVSTNPLSFIADAIHAVTGSLFGAVGLAVGVVVAFVVLVLFLHHRREEGGEDGAPPAGEKKMAANTSPLAR